MKLILYLPIVFALLGVSDFGGNDLIASFPEKMNWRNHAGFQLQFAPNRIADLDYFAGNWTMTMKDGNQQFKWTVKKELNDSWLTGVVEQNGVKVSTDFWREKDNKIERYAFTSGGVIVKMESNGWQANKMVLNGSLSDQTQETKVRETITKTSSNEFHALWEMQTPDGGWTVFGDEICTR